MQLQMTRVLVAIALLLVSSIASAGLIAHYDFNADASNQPAANLNATLRGNAAIVAAPGGSPAVISAGNVLTLDGAGDDAYVDVVAESLTGSFTVSQWVRVGDTIARTFFGTRSPSDQSFDVKFQNGTQIHGDVGTGGGWLDTSVDANLNYNTNTWYHVQYAVTGTEARIFVNGALQTTSTFDNTGTPLLFDSNHDIHIGQAGNGEFFLGQIDDVGIFDEAITNAEASAIYDLATNLDLVYDLSDANILFELHDSMTGTATVDGIAWEYATGLTGPIGQAVIGSNGLYELRLTAEGTGVEMASVPEPGTSALILLGASGLAAITRRKFARR